MPNSRLPAGKLAEGLFVEIEAWLGATGVIAKSVHCEDEPSGATVERKGTAGSVDLAAQRFVLTLSGGATLNVSWAASPSSRRDGCHARRPAARGRGQARRRGARREEDTGRVRGRLSAQAGGLIRPPERAHARHRRRQSQGGSGKSTLATHVAAWCAVTGRSAMLGDTDSQGSSSGWLKRRGASPDARGREILGWSADPRRVMRPPAGVTHVVLDAGGLRARSWRRSSRRPMP